MPLPCCCCKTAVVPYTTHVVDVPVRYRVLSLTSSWRLSAGNRDKNDCLNTNYQPTSAPCSVNRASHYAENSHYTDNDVTQHHCTSRRLTPLTLQYMTDKHKTLGECTPPPRFEKIIHQKKKHLFTYTRELSYVKLLLYCTTVNQNKVHKSVTTLRYCVQNSTGGRLLSSANHVWRLGQAC